MKLFLRESEKERIFFFREFLFLCGLQGQEQGNVMLKVISMFVIKLQACDI